jgi:hypothetical protein
MASVLMSVPKANGQAPLAYHQMTSARSVLRESGQVPLNLHQMSAKAVKRESGLPLLESRRSVPICVLLGNGRLKQDSRRTVSAPIAQLEVTLNLEKAKPLLTFAKSVVMANTCQAKHL